MSTRTDSILSRIRRPEYTGENRCTPCTVVNVAIAVVASAIVGVVSPLIAPVALGVFLAAIYLRGYLVPGTPGLTRRYFPDRVLRWFDKAPDRATATFVGAAQQTETFDAESILLEADILKFTPDGTDLQLTEEFDGEWRERIGAVRETDYRPQLARMLSVDESVDPETIGVEIEERTATVVRDDTPVAVWTAEAALIADIAAASLFRERIPRWDDMEIGAKGQLIHASRVFLERCPACDGGLALSEETVESCCRTAEVVTLACRECDTPVLEVEV